MGVKTTLAAMTPTGTHVTAAQSLGRSASQTLATAQAHIDDCVNALKQVVADATKGNGSDANLASLNTQITNLS